ncbi:AMP-dependent synthetase and ligase OS=Tsukamurella paurometabola (strain ATCC 8368 / DSM /CCUG 35730 / CIP 100753 / JCM 10117 / KCTC 9821 / NBRC 16120/ NCIMB 702349 / NCTC 13040) OX=521096 GN=Tpau_4103 PE=3 SV=1 [Tsukamurella paurometabola]|uniref:AMP-dependent synthetase and ligase n=1 Tax=Tsukamurella paurometabola (strain ATCC 8368 / DSM 20162 / CCUG 35730 / CIP 100753 / JCM 10117 / KCTC 9821 / NBRC 16120 / NCIMB 702349 / NCTC 13040) TaxID=521096 RepID=D5UNH7_TSUPD|nr:acyl-CoA synthetase [Tsukamurella paurometabola]ADG80672.1 AMP-dependent synthetase and ligase [Tsukamurella paurometabola DSM 20162]SUP40518.1 4-chlorobenzoate--CoA ligase [Tsukamurella paurometabola]
MGTSLASDLLPQGHALLRMIQRRVVDPARPDVALRALGYNRQYGPQAALVIKGAAENPDRAAIVDEHGTLTYAQYEAQSNALARGLRSTGLKAGDVIAVLARDHRGLMLIISAAARAGLRLAMMNTGFAKPQFAEVCAREKVQAVFHDSEFTSLLDALPDDMPRYLTWVDDTDTIPEGAQTIDQLAAGRETKRVPPPAQQGGFIILTSGTTGLPKGATRSKVPSLATAMLVDRIPFQRRGTVVIASPIFHSTGFAMWSAGMSVGCTTVTMRRFDPENTLKLIADNKADMLVAVPTMLTRMLSLPAETLAKYDTSSLKSVVVAGSAVSPELSERFQDTFGDVLYNVYGSTEVAVATVATPQNLRTAPGTVGKPPVLTTVRLYDENDRLVEGVGVRGRVFVRAGAPFEGYSDGRTKQIIDGHLSSGDMGHWDGNGLLHIDGRDDDMIVSGGENVYPLEVENLLVTRDDVVEAAVIGVPDEEFGQRLRAFVVLSDGAPEGDGEELTKDLKDFVRGNLARFKVPRDVVFLDTLPRNPTGKIVRRELPKD